MKYFLPYVLLLAGLPSCGESAVGAIEVSSQANTWVEIKYHWTGAFTGWGHDEYQVLYVRRGWFQNDEQLIGHLPYIGTPVLQRLAANTIWVRVEGSGSQPPISVTYTFAGTWPGLKQ
jgi:hypothetical protein